MQGFCKDFFSSKTLCGGAIALFLLCGVKGYGQSSGSSSLPPFPSPAKLAMSSDLPPLTVPAASNAPKSTSGAVSVPQNTAPAANPSPLPAASPMPAGSFPSASNTLGSANGTGRTPFPSAVNGRSAPPPSTPGKVGGFKAASPQPSRNNSFSAPKTNTPAIKNNANPKSTAVPKVKTAPIRKEAVKEIPVPENNIFTPLVRVPNTSISRIVGIPCHLTDFIAQHTSTLNRHNRIVDWWSLTEKLAIYNVWLIHAQDVQLCIDRYPKNAVPQSILPLLVSMQQAASQHLKTAEVEFIESQFILCNKYPELRLNLISAIRIADAEKRKSFFASRLPIPTDVPTTAVYNTKVNEISKIRTLTTKAKNLSLTIPLQFDAVQARIEQYNQAYAGLQTLFKKQGTPDDLLFQALDRATQARLEMVHSVIEYNQMISSYVAQTVAGYVEGSRFLATLNQRSQTVPVNKSSGLDREEKVLPVNYESQQEGVGISVNKESDQRERVSGNRAEARTGSGASPPKTFVQQPKKLHVVSTESTPQASSAAELGNKTSPPIPDSKPANGSPIPLILHTDPVSAPPPVLPDQKTEKANPESPTTGWKPFPPIIRGQMPLIAPANNKSEAPKGSSADNGLVSIPSEKFSAIKGMVQVLYAVNPKQSEAGNSPILEVPLSLKDAIGNGYDSKRRLNIVNSYWELRTLLAELTIEKGILAALQTTGSSLEQQLQQQGSNPDPNFAALVACWRSSVAESTARQTDLRIKIRDAQIALMEIAGRSMESGWPIPINFPYCGPSYRLEIGNARSDSFVLLSQLVLIPEKLQAIQSISAEMGRPETLFRPEIASLNQVSDCWIYLKILENKRAAALSFVKMVDSLNRSIALYVSNYSDSIPNDAFVKSLIGTY
ncbi:MAG: hypothetical protein Q4G69_09205 [Planctomycetia bacterium]|nr:hypothetical protein [Planctomycetia bacterium]